MVFPPLPLACPPTPIAFSFSSSQNLLLKLRGSTFSNFFNNCVFLCFLCPTRLFPLDITLYRAHLSQAAISLLSFCIFFHLLFPPVKIEILFFNLVEEKINGPSWHSEIKQVRKVRPLIPLPVLEGQNQTLWLKSVFPNDTYLASDVSRALRQLHSKQ